MDVTAGSAYSIYLDPTKSTYTSHLFKLQFLLGPVTLSSPLLETDIPVIPPATLRES